jgi:TonB family protein
MEGDLKTSRDGKFIYYYANGSICDEGMYQNNLATGVWKHYLFSTGKLMTEKSYALDSLDGPEVHYDKEGKKTLEGNNINGAMEGVWKYYNAGHLYAEKTYKADELVAEKRYNDKGKITADLGYKDGKFLSGARYDDGGDTAPFVFTPKDSLEPVFKYVEQMPSAPYNIGEYLSENIVYPKKAMKNDEHGRVIVRFVVNEVGSIEDATITRSVSMEIDAEAIRVVSAMPAWSPGIQNGEAVKVYYSLPINFELK